MRRARLLTPGPAEAHPDALLEMARPLFHHRTAAHRTLLAGLVAALKRVFCTTSDVLVLSSSGTGAMEASVSNLCARGETAIVVRAGKFGERFAEIAAAFGIEVVAIDLEPGRSVAPEAIRAALEKHPEAAAVFTTLCETSTGAAIDVAAIGEVVAASPACLVVDGISGVGGMEMRTDDWKVDVLIVGSQKALMLPPGLAFLSVSPKAWERIERVTPPSYYFDLKAYRRSIAKDDTPYTPAIGLIRAAKVALDAILEESVEAVWARHRRLARAARAAVEALGLELLSERPAEVVTAIRLPDEIDGIALLKEMEAACGVKVAGGQGDLKGRICRIAHMGYVDGSDVIVAVAALETALRRQGLDLPYGAASGAAQRSLEE